MSKVKDFTKSFLVFFIKVLIIHSVTYAALGIVFSNIFDYGVLYSMDGINTFMRGFDSVWIIVGPFLQPIRALIISIVLYPFRETVKRSKLGWLMLFGIFLGIGILATPNASVGSIEGIIYTKLPIKFHIMGLPETIIQTFLFSFFLWLCEALPFQEANIRIRKFILKILSSFILGFLGAVALSLAGFITFKLLNIDIKNAVAERSNLTFIMAISFLTVLISYFLGSLSAKNKLWYILLAPLYIAIYAILPYFYNKAADTVYNNNISLIASIAVSIFVIIISIPLFSIFVSPSKTEEEIKEGEENKTDTDEKNTNGDNADNL